MIASRSQARRRGATRRRPRLRLAVALAALGAGCAGEPAPVDLGGSSLLLVTIDTLRADRLGAYGHAAAETPVLDALAARGVRFESCYSSVPLTLPSHATMFTGRYPFAHGVRNNGSYHLAAHEATLAEALRSAGYQTAAFVSSFTVSSKFGLGQGFERYDDGLDGGQLLHGFASEIPADRVVDRFLAWLAESRQGKFFAWIHLYDPHLPYAPPSPWAERFAEDPYDGEVAFTDAQIGRALAGLEAAGRRGETLVVVTSDHGEAFGEHGETGHGILAYDEALKVPLILAAGDRLGPAVVRERVRLVDLAPTLLDLLGVQGLEAGEPGGGAETEGRGDLDGRSFAALVGARGGAASADDEPRAVYFESVLGEEDYNWAPITGLIEGRHKFIALPEPELYDLEADPGETENLAGRLGKTAGELDAALQALLLGRDAEDPASRRELTPEDAARLRSLGYLSGSSSRSAERIDPKRGLWADRLLKEIRASLDAGDAAAARAELDRLLAEAGGAQSPALFAIRHEVLIAEDRAEAARRVLEEGMARFPDTERLPFLLAHLLAREGRLAEAEAVARGLLEVRPLFSQARILLAEAVERQGRKEEALGHYEAALELEPNSLGLRRRLAETALAAGRQERALEIHDRLADGDLAGDAEWLYRTAALNSRLGRPERAETLFRRGLEIAPAGIHHLTFALLLAGNGKLDQATTQAEIALGRYGADLTPEQAALARQALAQWRGGA